MPLFFLKKLLFSFFSQSIYTKNVMNYLPFSTSKTASEGTKKLEVPRFQLGFDFVLSPSTLEIMTLHEEEIGGKIKVEPKVMEVLLCLIEQEGQVVSQEYLIEKIWDNYGGAKEALMQAVSKLRKLLQDDAQQQRTIQTISKKGYRLLLPVRTLSGEGYQAFVKEGSNNKRQKKIGAFTGFVERLTQPKFFLAFLFLSLVILMGLAISSYIIFWLAMIID